MVIEPKDEPRLMSKGATYTNDFKMPDGSVPVITSIVVDRGTSHDIVRVWNKGALAGTLVVKAGDGDPIAKTLIRTGLK